VDQILDVSSSASSCGFAFVALSRDPGEVTDVGRKKDRHLISELKEQDSYVNSDWESESEDGDADLGQPHPSTSTSTSITANGSRLRNSMIETANVLVAVAAQVERPPGASSPDITIRLTRMEEHPEGGHLDDRIPASFEAIRAMGVKLVFGDLADRDLATLAAAPPPPVPVLPSWRINLDPTACVGLCSDILHHPLPATEADARRRFLRPADADADAVNGENGGESSGSHGSNNFKSLGGSGDLGGSEPTYQVAQSKNSRELLKEVLEEMESPVIELLRDILDEAMRRARDRGEEVGGVEFWATKEAVRHLREAMCSDETIGEGMEQRRMRRLVGLDQGDFFEGSRYEGKAGVLDGLKLRVFDDDEPGPSRPPMCEKGMRSFHRSMAAACSQFLDEYYASSTAEPSSYPTDTLPAFLRPDKMPVPKIAQLTLPFPIVTLHAARRGAAEGMTTLSMGNVVFREMFATPRWRVKAWAQGNYDLEHRDAEDGKRTDHHAVVWMLPYRSFAEGKRVRFEKGDYSLPPPLSQ
jgi:hypothetical protein